MARVRPLPGARRLDVARRAGGSWISTAGRAGLGDLSGKRDGEDVVQHRDAGGVEGYQLSAISYQPLAWPFSGARMGGGEQSAISNQQSAAAFGGSGLRPAGVDWLIARSLPVQPLRFGWS